MNIDLSRVEVGELLISKKMLARTCDDLERYAEASGDLNPLHLDKEFAMKAGFEDRVVHGMLNMALLANLLTDNFAADDIVSYSARFEGVLLVNQETLDTVRLLERKKDSVVLELLSENSQSKSIIRGRAEIRLLPSQV